MFCLFEETVFDETYYKQRLLNFESNGILFDKEVDTKPSTLERL